MAKLETESTRDLQGLTYSGILVLAFGAGALALFALDHWGWWILGVGFTIISLAGLSVMFDDAQRVPRDAKNKRI